MWRAVAGCRSRWPWRRRLAGRGHPSGRGRRSRPRGVRPRARRRVALQRGRDPARMTEPSTTASAFNRRAISGSGGRCRLNCIADVREITRIDPSRAMAAVIASVMPSAKNSCESSPERFSKGRTTIVRRPSSRAGLPCPRAAASSAPRKAAAVGKRAPGSFDNARVTSAPRGAGTCGGSGGGSDPRIAALISKGVPPSKGRRDAHISNRVTASAQRSARSSAVPPRRTSGDM